MIYIKHFQNLKEEVLENRPEETRQDKTIYDMTYLDQTKFSSSYDRFVNNKINVKERDVMYLQVLSPDNDCCCQLSVVGVGKDWERRGYSQTRPVRVLL